MAPALVLVARVQQRSYFPRFQFSCGKRRLTFDIMFNNLTFAFIKTGANTENKEFYTECFEKIGIMELVYKTFSMKSTVEAKFMYVYDLLENYKKLPMENTMVNVKDNMEASIFRSQSNMYFKMGNYVKAVQGYNNCVMVAVVGSKEYAIALANRSAALFKLEKYENSIVDIHLALANNYPSQLAYKLYKREVECLVNMGKMSEAKLKFKVRIIMLLLCFNTINY